MKLKLTEDVIRGIAYLIDIEELSFLQAARKLGLSKTTVEKGYTTWSKRKPQKLELKKHDIVKSPTGRLYVVCRIDGGTVCCKHIDDAVSKGRYTEASIEEFKTGLWKLIRHQEVKEYRMSKEEIERRYGKEGTQMEKRNCIEERIKKADEDFIYGYEAAWARDTRWPEEQTQAYLRKAYERYKLLKREAE